MGARTFIEESEGKNIYIAYSNAVGDALYGYGRDQYNGTISTTSGVLDRTKLLKEFVDDLGVRDGRNKWVRLAIDNTEKYSDCWGARVGDDMYLFVGWAVT